MPIHPHRHPLWDKLTPEGKRELLAREAALQGAVQAIARRGRATVNALTLAALLPAGALLRVTPPCTVQLDSVPLRLTQTGHRYTLARIERSRELRERLDCHRNAQAS